MTKKTIKKLTRSQEDRMVAGVCGGFAKYMAIDSTIIRLFVAFLTLITGLLPGFLMYFVAWVIIPE